VSSKEVLVDQSRTASSYYDGGKQKQNGCGGLGLRMGMLLALLGG
jgi:hypothetical protein